MRSPRPALLVTNSLLPDRQENNEQDAKVGKQRTADQALHDNLVLQRPQVRIVHHQLAIEDHEPGHLAQETRGCRLGRGGIIKALPRQRLAAREQQEEEAAATEAREDQADAQPPEGPRGEGVEAGVGADVRRESAEEDDQEANEGEDDAEAGGNADGLEGTVADA